MHMEHGTDVTIQTQGHQESAFYYVSFSGNCELLDEIINHSDGGGFQLAVKHGTLGCC